MVMEVLPGNGLQSTLASAIGTTDTTLTIQAADAAIWPTSGLYRAMLCQDVINGPFELVKVTGGQGTATLTITRAVESYHGAQSARSWPIGTVISAVITKQGVDTVMQARNLKMHREEFLPAASATTVTVSLTPETLVMVARGGVVQSLAAGHYTLAGAVLTFASSFTGSERVIISYSVRGEALP